MTLQSPVAENTLEDRFPKRLPQTLVKGTRAI
jgi:hypothetical protein